MDRTPELMTIAQLPIEMRPREKLLKHGASALTDTELLALFLRTGIKGKNVFVMAQELLDRFKGFAGLIHASAAELKTCKGMGGDAKRSQLVAVLEMARRALTQQLTETTVMNSPNAVKQYLQLELAQLKHEVFAVLFLDAHNRLLSYQPMFRGSLSQTMVYPREVAKTALALGADGVVLAHNHPGGTVKPSQADMKLTRTLQESLALIDVTVRDHIIVAQGKYLSMAEEGLL
jgi:DNA repair protein RadC